MSARSRMRCGASVEEITMSAARNSLRRLSKPTPRPAKCAARARAALSVRFATTSCRSPLARRARAVPSAVLPAPIRTARQSSRSSKRCRARSTATEETGSGPPQRASRAEPACRPRAPAGRPRRAEAPAALPPRRDQRRRGPGPGSRSRRPPSNRGPRRPGTDARRRCPRGACRGRTPVFAEPSRDCSSRARRSAASPTPASWMMA